jgi:hypothetical protein
VSNSIDTGASPISMRFFRIEGEVPQREIFSKKVFVLVCHSDSGKAERVHHPIIIFI